MDSLNKTLQVRFEKLVRKFETACLLRNERVIEEHLFDFTPIAKSVEYNSLLNEICIQAEMLRLTWAVGTIEGRKPFYELLPILSKISRLVEKLKLES